MKKRFAFLFILWLTSCTSQPAPQQQAAPTAYIAPSYPTVESPAITSNQASSGVQVNASRAWRDGKQVNVDICFTLPDSSDWQIWSANLKYADVVISEFGTTMASLQEPANGQPGLRCDTLSFLNVPPDADLSSVTVTVDSIASPPRAEDYCSIYMPKIQQALNERGVAITLTCTDVAGAQTMQIASKPDSMSQEDAEKIVYSDEFYTIQGPWSFTFNLGQ